MSASTTTSTFPSVPEPRRLDLTYRPVPGALAGLPIEPEPPRRARPTDALTREALAERILPPVVRNRPDPPEFTVDRRGVPHLDGVAMRRTADGGWHHQGGKGTYHATIHPDGGIGFGERKPVSYEKFGALAPPPDPSGAPGKSTGSHVVGVTFSFDITDAIMRRLGQDPYGAEKIRFARLTERFRAGLRAAHQRRRETEELARFSPPDALCRTYAARDPAGREAMRRWLFARWDETTEATRGAPLRQAVLAAVTHCRIAYDPEELARLNARRTSAVAFTPVPRPRTEPPGPAVAGEPRPTPR